MLKKLNTYAKKISKKETLSSRKTTCLHKFFFLDSIGLHSDKPSKINDVLNGNYNFL